MKRYILILVCCFLILTLAGCTQTETEDHGNVIFYYRSATDSYQPDSSIITPDRRTVENTTQIQSVLELYFDGPEDSGLISPFPKQTTLLDIVIQDNSVTLTLSNSFTGITGFDRTVACVCIAKTVFSLTGCDQVTIISGDITDPGCVNITLRADDILLTDIQTIRSVN